MSKIDASVLERLDTYSNPGQSFAAEVLDLYLKETPSQFEKLKADVGRGERRAVNRAAHALKASSGNIGASAAMNAFARIEALTEVAYPETEIASLMILLEVEIPLVLEEAQTKRSQILAD